MLTEPTTAPRWVRLWLRGAAVYGVLVLTPLLFMPPPVPAALLTFYGFTLTALAFQAVFWIIGGDPVRFRPLMLAGVLEKLAFGVPALLLTPRGLAPPTTLVFGAIDLALGLGFLVAWRATPRR